MCYQFFNIKAKEQVLLSKSNQERIFTEELAFQPWGKEKGISLGKGRLDSVPC